MKKESYIHKLKREIIELQQIQKILRLKDPSHDFLEPLIANAIANMLGLLCYLEGKNSYYVKFNEAFFNNRQTTMHRVFFSDLHITTEDGLKKIINEHSFEVLASRFLQASSIVKEIKLKLKIYSPITKELKQIIRLGGNFPIFNDYLNAVLNGIKGLDKKYKAECRTYFDAINILRNKVSHSGMTLTEGEKAKLIAAKFKKTISDKGELQMTFEGYRFLITDVVHFFDKLYANL